MQLYEKIQFLRKHKNMTQSQLAEKIDVTRQSVQKWESGISSPDITKLPELATILGVSTDQLLDSSISQEDLLSPKKETNTVVTHSKQYNRSVLDYMLLVPIFLGLFICVFMFYMIGGIFVGIGFGTALLGVVAPIYSIFLLVINFSNGIESILISISIALLGLGLVYPVFLLSKLWLKIYINESERIYKELKNKNYLNIFIKNKK